DPRALPREVSLPPSSRGSAALDAHRDALADPDAERGHPALRVSRVHRVEERDEDAAAARADRVAERDGSTTYVDLLGVELEAPDARDRLRGERLVELDEVEAPDVPSRASERLLAGGDRPLAHEVRLDAR